MGKRMSNTSLMCMSPTRLDSLVNHAATLDVFEDVGWVIVVTGLAKSITVDWSRRDWGHAVYLSKSF